uniref:Auxin-repressed 12.5 kDa protein n=1 Tax=Noccaea caerulescens TaxID=107243 RepID=A0A1J3FPX0_NOCCA
MGLLDHLWDDTVAGPRPENGLGKLRKHHTFSFRPSSGNDQSDGGTARSYGEDSPEDAVKVTRSIMIIKPPGYQGGSAPVSPAGSTPPVSPFSEQTQEERNPFGLGDGRHRTRGPIRQQQEYHHQSVDQGALLLLTACDL